MRWVWQQRSANPPGSNPIDSPGTPVTGGMVARPRGVGRVRVATDGRDVLLNTPDGWEVDQPWLWWSGPAGSDGTGGPFGSPLRSDGDPYGYSCLASVARCTSLIVDTIAGMPWNVFRGDYEQLPTPDWMLDPMALRPDGRVLDGAGLPPARLSAMEFWAQWITAALWFGDGYVYAPVRDANGAPVPPLWQLHPCDVAIDGGRYWVGDVLLEAGSVIHLRGAPPYWNGHGRGVITTNGRELGLAATVRDYAAGVFTSGVPAGYLKSSQPSMTAEQAQALKAAWLAQHGGSQRSIAVLNATTDFTPISISPIDAQLKDTREWVLRDVALAFGVPAYMLGAPGDSSTYANVESRMTELKTFTLLPWIRRIESHLDAEWPRGTSVKINADAVLRADTSQRITAEAAAVAAGIYTVDEARALENLPPLGVGGIA